jgi:hypothetical protein
MTEDVVDLVLLLFFDHIHRDNFDNNVTVFSTACHKNTTQMLR